MDIKNSTKFFLMTAMVILLSIGQQSLSYSQDNRNTKYLVSSLEWNLWGYRPNVWEMDFDFIRLSGKQAQYQSIPVEIPGSVQKALKDKGIIPDWNIGLNSTDIEWIENRHWIFAAQIPDQWISRDKKFLLHCKGLDDNGIIMINGKEAGKFNNAFIPCQFDITDYLEDKNNTLAIIFKCPPAYLGQIGYTSKIKDWKPRFYYGWDWIPRIVQIGIWDDIFLEVCDKEPFRLEEIKVNTEVHKMDDLGNLKISAEFTPSALRGKVRIQLTEENSKDPVIDELVPAVQLRQGKQWDHLKIKRWWPNGHGEQVLYKLKCTLYAENDNDQQVIERNVGFRNVEWLPFEGAPAEADPWICSVNNREIFLQGVNWTPIRPNFADLREDDYRKLIETYKNLGVNIFRVWGGGFPEKDCFYDLCDEMGILIWQDFPLSSSGLDNYPPDTPEEILTMSKIVENYVKRLRHHPSLLLWCGGNELYKKGDTGPVTDNHPMIRCIKKIVKAEDPERRFVPGSPSGPAIYGGLHNFGKGVCWDVHGPWRLPFTESDRTMNAVKNFWNQDDALMHSEVGVAGAMSAEMINKYRGEYPALPANIENPLWRRVNWWIEWDDFLKDHDGRKPHSLEEYVAWSQQRQATGLSIALKANKSRFPQSGGFIIWMGHDSYPCPVNTSIIDFEGNPKPVAIELSRIWKKNPDEL